jgi:hypothetical protein
MGWSVQMRQYIIAFWKAITFMNPPKYTRLPEKGEVGHKPLILPDLFHCQTGRGAFGLSKNRAAAILLWQESHKLSKLRKTYALLF